MQSELEVHSIELIRKALERKSRDAKDPALRPLIEQISAANARPAAKRMAPAQGLVNNEPVRMRGQQQLHNAEPRLDAHGGKHIRVFRN